MRRLLAVIILLTVVETGWALFCAETSVNLFLYFAGLVAASVVFWIPGVVQEPTPAKSAETNR